MSVIDEASRKVEISNIYVVDSNCDELRLGDMAMSFGQETGIVGNYVSYSVKGGDCITVTALENQDITVYGADGRILYQLRACEGTTKIEVPAGMYIVNGKKVLVK